MSPPAKKTLRIVLGLIAGFLGGSLLAAAVVILLFVVCVVTNGADPPKRQWVTGVFLCGQGIVAILGPAVGTIYGMRCATRRNRSEDSKPS